MTQNNDQALNFMEPKISLDRDGLHIVSHEVKEKLEKKKLSASMVTSLEGCSARWLADTFVVRDLIEEEPDNAARRGSMFHKVMEDVFALPQNERTPASVREITASTLVSDDFKDLGLIPDAVSWLKDAINGYYSMGGDPRKVEVAMVPSNRKNHAPEPGLEVFVKGKVGNTDKEILGFIDQVTVNPVAGDGSVIVNDWKSGTKAKVWKSHTKSDEGLAEQRQQIIYSMLLSDMGVNVSAARLIYPVARTIVPVNLKDADLRKTVITSVESTEKKLNHLIENNTFEFEPSFLCAWCPLAKICPAATIKPYAKMKEAYAKQPEPAVLTAGIDIK